MREAASPAVSLGESSAYDGRAQSTSPATSSSGESQNSRPRGKRQQRRGAFQANAAQTRISGGTRAAAASGQVAANLVQTVQRLQGEVDGVREAAAAKQAADDAAKKAAARAANAERCLADRRTARSRACGWNACYRESYGNAPFFYFNLAACLGWIIACAWAILTSWATLTWKPPGDKWSRWAGKKVKRWDELFKYGIVHKKSIYRVTKLLPEPGGGSGWDLQLDEEGREVALEVRPDGYRTQDIRYPALPVQITREDVYVFPETAEYYESDPLFTYGTSTFTASWSIMKHCSTYRVAPLTSAPGTIGTRVSAEAASFYRANLHYCDATELIEGSVVAVTAELITRRRKVDF